MISFMPRHSFESVASELAEGLEARTIVLRHEAAQLRSRFDALVAEWKAGTRFVSSVIEMATHPAYQHIIGLGPKAVPLILQSLAASPDHWFWALKAITAADPVPEDVRGDLPAMTTAWLQWGRSEGYECKERS